MGAFKLWNAAHAAKRVEMVESQYVLCNTSLRELGSHFAVFATLIPFTALEFFSVGRGRRSDARISIEDMSQWVARAIRALSSADRLHFPFFLTASWDQAQSLKLLGCDN